MPVPRLRLRDTIRLSSLQGESWAPVALVALPRDPDTAEPAAPRAVIATRDGGLLLWSATAGAARRPVTTGVADVIGLRAHRDGRRVVVAGRGGEVEVWDLVAGRCVGAMALPVDWAYVAEPAHGLALILSDRYALVSTAEHEGPDSFQVLYDLETYRHDGFLRMGPGQRDLVAGTTSTGILFEASIDPPVLTARSLQPDADVTPPQLCVDAPHRALTCLALLPALDQVATAGEDGVIKVWDEDDLVVTLPGHHGPVHDIAGADSAWPWLFASVGEDRALRLWDMEHRYDPGSSPLLDQYTHDRPLLCCAIASGAELVLAIDRAGDLLVLEVAIGTSGAKRRIAGGSDKSIPYGTWCRRSTYGRVPWPGVKEILAVTRSRGGW